MFEADIQTRLVRGRFFGVALLLLSLAGLTYSARASLGQILYFQAKFGFASDDTDRIVRRCRRAHRLYPFNYLACAWVSERAWYSRWDSLGNERPSRVAEVEMWCDRGLELNFYKDQLRRMKARLLARESPLAAAEYWSEYVDWEFWDDYNHAELVRLYAAAGDFAMATKSLQLIEGSSYHGDAERVLQEAWRRELSTPPPPMD